MAQGGRFNRIYVSIDFEGLPGIAGLTMLGPRSPQYSVGRLVSTRIARFIAEQLLEHGFSPTIADSHGTMTNIDYLEMPRGTLLIQGFPRMVSMLTGLDEGYDAAFFIGYHAAAGTRYGVLDHSYSGRTFHAIYLNGEQASEYLLNALAAGEIGVPVALVAGDSVLEEEVRRHTPWAVFVALKKGYGRYAAGYESLPDILSKLSRGIEVAVSRIRRRETRPLRIEPPYRLRMILRRTEQADAAELVPGVRRVDAYTLEYTADSAIEIVKLVEAIAFIGYAVSHIS